MAGQHGNFGLASRRPSSTDRKGGTTLHLCTRVEKGTGQIKGHLLSCAADSGLIAGTKSGLVEAPDIDGLSLLPRCCAQSWAAE